MEKLDIPAVLKQACLQNRSLSLGDVSDIKMPGMDGLEFIRKIRSLGPDAGGSVPVIAMSAFMRGERAYILGAGFQACFPKPFTPGRLSETILAVLTTSSLR